MSIYLFPSKNNVGNGRLISEARLRDIIRHEAEAGALSYNAGRIELTESSLIIHGGRYIFDGYIFVIEDTEIPITQIPDEFAVLLRPEYDQYGYISNISIELLDISSGWNGMLPTDLLLGYGQTNPASVIDTRLIYQGYSKAYLCKADFTSTYEINGYLVWTLTSQTGNLCQVVDSYKIKFLVPCIITMKLTGLTTCEVVISRNGETEETVYVIEGTYTPIGGLVPISINIDSPASYLAFKIDTQVTTTVTLNVGIIRKE